MSRALASDFPCESCSEVTGLVQRPTLLLLPVPRSIMMCCRWHKESHFMASYQDVWLEGAVC